MQLKYICNSKYSHYFYYVYTCARTYKYMRESCKYPCGMIRPPVRSSNGQ